MEKILYKLEQFEGPLDLLLHLIQKNKVSIYDIPIVEITDQYLEAICDVEDTYLENASEFLVLAAQLLYIKSKLLLPKSGDEEEEEDPRDDLARRLAEYQQYKEVSKDLRQSEFKTRYLFFKGQEKIKFPVPEYDKKHEVDELIRAFDDIYQRRLQKQPPQKRAFSGIVGREKVSVDDMVKKVQAILRQKKQVTFGTVFKLDDTKPEKIATFLALLEMVKLSKIEIDYDLSVKEFIIKQRNEVK